MGPGKEDPPPPPLLAARDLLVKNFGGWVLEVREGREGGPIVPLVVVVPLLPPPVVLAARARCDQEEALMTRLASLTARWSGFMNSLRSSFRSPICRASPVVAVARSPQAWIFVSIIFGLG